MKMLVGLKLISSLFCCTTKAVNHTAVDRDVTRSESKRSSVDEYIQTNGGTSESLAIVQSSARCRWCCMRKGPLLGPANVTAQNHVIGFGY